MSDELHSDELHLGSVLPPNSALCGKRSVPISASKDAWKEATCSECLLAASRFVGEQAEHASVEAHRLSARAIEKHEEALALYEKQIAIAERGMEIAARAVSALNQQLGEVPS